MAPRKRDEWCVSLRDGTWSACKPKKPEELGQGKYRVLQGATGTESSSSSRRRFWFSSGGFGLDWIGFGECCFWMMMLRGESKLLLTMSSRSSRLFVGPSRDEMLQEQHHFHESAQLLQQQILARNRVLDAESGKGKKCRFGLAVAKNMLGHPIEDRYYARIVEHKGMEIGMFGVFDGHKGGDVADFLQQFLFESILEHPQFEKNPKTAIREAYLALDKRILDMGSVSKSWRSGSTATTCLLFNGEHLIVANVGDSRAVLSRGGQAIDISVDHEPQKPEEREMVESKGGEVSKTFGGVYRVDRRLAMSRAFGDYDLKEHITVEPDIWEGSLSADDQFFIVASDGLWHKISSQEAVNLILEEPDVKMASEALVELALEKKETDDISVIVVNFK